jgi:hypothetical protein
MVIMEEEASVVREIFAATSRGIPLARSPGV